MSQQWITFNSGLTACQLANGSTTVDTLLYLTSVLCRLKCASHTEPKYAKVKVLFFGTDILDRQSVLRTFTPSNGLRTGNFQTVSLENTLASTSIFQANTQPYLISIPSSNSARCWCILRWYTGPRVNTLDLVTSPSCSLLTLYGLLFSS
ncbi:hypothetical protein CRM22_003795 [Opisthorchis felineus]|uniref:Uncharacterized protein n=1 Tax=Opisthorchis felineus TaxID=147828 RepID=A0A4S2LZE4_OPIFE|nr:hypothetical protein CRM22_003795 [Opisthorchis felineus]